MHTTLARNYRNAGRHGILVHQSTKVAGITQPTAPYFASYMGNLVRAYAVAKALPIPATAPSVVLQYHTGKTIVYRLVWWVGMGTPSVHSVVSRVAVSARNPARTRVLGVSYGRA